MPYDSRFCNQCGRPVSGLSEHPSVIPRLTSRRILPIHRTPATIANERKGQSDQGKKRATVLEAAKNSPSSNDKNGFIESVQSNDIFDNLRSLMPSGMIRKSDAMPAYTGGEQREVTVLFLDVTNFTDASHRLDSEDIYMIVDEAMRLLVEIVYKYEGTVDKFTGDGLIALFGAPIAHENDPERAVRASLEMLQVLKPLHHRTMTQHNFDFQIRIGINTGLVIAGSLGNDLHMEYTVIGDTVNQASRMEIAAEPGSVLVSFSTYQRTRPIFNFVTLPWFIAKGIPESIRAYRPIQIREQPDSVRGLPGMRGRMLGRDQDMARLHNAMENVKKEGQRHISLITGDAGLGKSRLVVEFCEGLRAQNIRSYRGSCLAYARSRPMWVIADIIRDIVDIAEIDPVELQVERLREFIARQLMDEAEVLPVLLHLLELELPTNMEQGVHEKATQNKPPYRSDDVLRQVLLNFQMSPFVLVFDDLHWVDPTSRQFLISLIEASADVPLHLILISRDFERLIAIRPILDVCATYPDVFEEIRLRALSDDDNRLLVNQYIWQTSSEIEELNEIIVARAEGNPFYTEEIVRMLMDKGGIVEQGSGWKTTNYASDLLRAVPGTLRDLILARFDQLEASTRHTLQRAAILGRFFPARLLEELHDGDMASLLEQLDELSNRQFLREETVNSERVLSFQHTLIQEAIYSTLLKRERRRLHGLVADVISDTNFWLPEEQTLILAYHYSESSNPTKAIPYLAAKPLLAAQPPLFANVNSHSLPPSGPLTDEILHSTTENSLLLTMTNT